MGKNITMSLDIGIESRLSLTMKATRTRYIKTWSACLSLRATTRTMGGEVGAEGSLEGATGG